ncbi:MAG: insulinase family protein [Pyrinomonadaceae bacterium]|nr:insulinase family protein [Pyrinomonadaceae bacterium]
MKSAKLYIGILLCLITLSIPALAQRSSDDPKFKVEYEKFTLDNGLDVVFHIDRSDPVVAVNLTAHVGSAREKAGRTGFAHMFEHLLFLESENLGKGGLDKMSARIGGSGANGSTSRDRTNYLQTVPNDALEKMLWAEADKLGWFINTVTDPVLAKEKQVVKNEKRQGVDNAPYGHNFYVIDKNLYPEDHPYNWQVIGSLDDLQAATLADVKEFFRRWYVPNNVTLTVAGDFDPIQAKKWVKKYFSEIKRGEAVKPLPKRPGVVNEIKKLYHEDNFARLPQLTRSYPTVEQYHPDQYALDVLFQYLSQGKKAPLYKVLVEDKKLVPGVNAFHRTDELAGQVYLIARAFNGKDLDEVNKAIDEAYSLFEKEGISEKDLARIKAGQETQFYNGLSSVLGKGSQLALYNIYTGDPGFIEKEIESILAVSTNDVRRVYDKYIKDKNYVVTSFVPKGQAQLAIEGSKKAEVKEESIAQKDDKVNPNVKAEYERTPSTFDRTKEPPYGTAPEVKVPVVWETKLKNGMRVFGIQNSEVPLVDFVVSVEGGQLLDNTSKVGVANLTAELMSQGTKNKTPQELEEAIQQLGASINVSAGTEEITIRANTLSKNYQKTLALVEEMLLEPRWDLKEFERIKRQTINQIRARSANPTAIAQSEFNKLVYGEKNIRSRNILGTIDSVDSIVIDDLKAFYQRNFSPMISRMGVVGDIDRRTVEKSLKGLAKRWNGKQVSIPKYQTPDKPKESRVYFYDVPNSKQSVIYFGYPALAVTDKDYYRATIMNYRLGGGGFASELTQQLREGKGYTYGIFSTFQGTKEPGPFYIFSRIRSNVTLEGAQLVKKILDDYPEMFGEKDLETTKGFLIKSNARAFETANAKLNLLNNISKYGWDYDYVKRREAVVKSMTVGDIKELSEKYLDTNKMIWLVVGDAKTQLSRLKELGFGEPILLNDVKASGK